MSCFILIEFVTEDWFTKHTNITTKLNWKLFTKVIKSPSEEAWGLDRQRVWLKEKLSALIKSV